ncbi:hypothetical protein D3C85_1938930 [compost metagenome]
MFYILALSTAVYCIRSDLANFLSQTFKVGGLAVVGYWFGHSVLNVKEGRGDARS